MPDNKQELIDEVKSIYNDTNYFIDAITEEYGFYAPFIEALCAGMSSVNVTRKEIHKSVEEQWISAIESCLPVLDYVIRNVGIGMEEREEVLPIEVSKKINSRSIRHLAQHTDYIKEFREDGTILPSKILNVYREETLLTYENRFINTLLQRLYSFVEKRYKVLSGRSLNEKGVGVELNGAFRFGESDGRLSLKLEVSDPTEIEGVDNALARLEKIRASIIMYMESPFVKQMGNNYIHPPVMRTNAIQKNKYLRECLDLWDFIESYEGLGYTVESEETKEKPQEDFIKQVYSLMSLQYLMFDYNIHHGIENMPDVLKARQPERNVRPRFVTHFEKKEVKDRNSYDYEYRKVVNLKESANRTNISQNEKMIKELIDEALLVDKEMNTPKFG